MIIEMRPQILTYGLLELINYINLHRPTKNMTMIEIGCYAGESTVIFSDHFKNVITIDPLQPSYHEGDSASESNFLEVYQSFLTRTFDRKNIQLIRLKSDDAINIIENKVDFVYIDGVHTYEQVKKDIINYRTLINDGGFIGGHDYVDGWKDVVRAIHEVYEKVDKTFSDYSWIKKL